MALRVNSVPGGPCSFLKDAMEGILGGVYSSCQLPKANLDYWKGLQGPDGETLRCHGLEVMARWVHCLASTSCSLLKDFMKRVLSSTQSRASCGQLLQLSLHQWEGL